MMYFKQAADSNNYSAEVNYIKYAYDMGVILEPTEYVLGMLKKYQDSINDRKQEMLIILAISYTNIDRNLKEAAKIYLQAIEINPKHRKFRVSFISFVFDWRGSIDIHLFYYFRLIYRFLDLVQNLINSVCTTF